MKQQPAWYEAVIQHPPDPGRARAPIPRADSDLPRSLQNGTVAAARARASALDKGRSALNTKKKLRTQMPSLRAKPIVYDGDRVRRQFFRDHPWEAKKPRTLVEMDFALEEQMQPDIPAGEEPELYHWSRMNPSVEDVIQCTLRTSADCQMSLAQAYQRTIAAYHAIQAEREHMLRFANLEARSLGADLGPTETERGYRKEERELAKWAPSADPATVATAAADVVSAMPSPRLLRANSTYTGGEAYLTAASNRGQKRAEAAQEPTDKLATRQADTADFLSLGSSRT